MKWIRRYEMNLMVGTWESYRRAILNMLEPNPNVKVLDLGSGEGYFTRRIAQHVRVPKVWGTDLERKVGTTGFQGCDLNKEIPYADASFDVVVASHIIEHLFDTDRFAREIHRVLKDDGYAIISTPNLAAWHNIVYLLLGKQPETAAVSDEMNPWVEAPGHRRIFTTTELFKFLKFHLFRVEKVVGTSMPPVPTGLANLLCKFDRRHADVITVKVRKR